MTSINKGKFNFLSLFLLLFFGYSRLFSLHVCGDIDLPDEGHESEAGLDKQESQLIKFEQLVQNLSELVSKLESRLLDCPRSLYEKDNAEIARLAPKGIDRIATRDSVDRRSVGGIDDGFFEGKVTDGERAKAVSVTKYSPLWSERFQFASAVKLDSNATCINVLPFRDYEGINKYVAVGDDMGRIYVFLRNGDVVVEFYTMTESPITAMLSYISVYRNESMVVTGHRNGWILVHRVWEASNGEEWGSLEMESFGASVTGGNEGGNFRITALEVHHVGRVRYILSADESGKITVFRENGTIYGSVVPTGGRPLTFLKQRLLFLTESGAGSLDLRTMKVKESECEGLNNSLAKNYVFDVTERSKAYGFTSDGDLIHVLLLGDIVNFKCRVRSKRKIDMDSPLVLQAIKGYLIIVNPEKIFVYNISSHHYAKGGGVPRLLFFAGHDEIRSLFLNNQVLGRDGLRREVLPLIGSDRERLVVLGLGDGYVGIYCSKLPVFKAESNTILWTSPVLLFILFLFGAWYFFSKKKEALTSWGPDDPFSPSSGERPFTNSSSRTDDVIDLRGGGIRGGPPRRYISPSEYPSGAAGSFRPGSGDHNSRPTSVDRDYRATSELKFRGANVEATGFPKR